MKALITQLQQSSLAAIVTIVIATTHTVKMTNSVKFYGGVNELKAFLDHLHNNFNVYNTQFPCEELKVNYACGLLGQWSEHPYKELQSMGETVMNPVDWKTDLYKAEDPCLATFDEFKAVICVMYSDPNHYKNVIIRVI